MAKFNENTVLSSFFKPAPFRSKLYCEMATQSVIRYTWGNSTSREYRKSFTILIMSRKVCYYLTTMLPFGNRKPGSWLWGWSLEGSESPLGWLGMLCRSISRRCLAKWGKTYQVLATPSWCFTITFAFPLQRPRISGWSSIWSTPAFHWFAIPLSCVDPLLILASPL